MIQGLIPYSGGKVLLDCCLLSLGDVLYFSSFFLELSLSLLKGDFINFVNKDKDSSVLVELLDASESHFKVLDAFVELLAVVLDVEHVD